MCRKGGRRCPSHSDQVKISARNARRRAKYQASNNVSENNLKSIVDLKKDVAKVNVQNISTTRTKKSPNKGFIPNDINPEKIYKELSELNTSGDMYYVPKSFKIIRDTGSNLVISVRSVDDTLYELHMSKNVENGGVLAFKSYEQDEDNLDGDDEELITESRPVIRLPYNEFQTEGEYEGVNNAETISLNLLDMVERMDNPETNWNKDETAARFLYFGEAHYDINSALRNESELNPKLVETLDGIMSEHTLKKETVVYRGIRGNDSVLEEIKSGNYRDLGYLSTTTDENIAKKFSGGGNENSAVMKITLPTGTKCQDLSEDSEKEIALPRNFDLSKAEWTFFD